MKSIHYQLAVTYRGWEPPTYLVKGLMCWQHFSLKKANIMGKSSFRRSAHFRVLCCIKVSTDVTEHVCIVIHEKKWVSAHSCLFWDFGKFSPYFHPDPNAIHLTVELLGDPPSVPEVAFIHRVRLPDVYETDMHGGDTPIWPLRHSVSSPPFSLLRCPHWAYVCPHIRLMRETRQMWLDVARVHV
jgi:hypothetical protein